MTHDRPEKGGDTEMIFMRTISQAIALSVTLLGVQTAALAQISTPVQVKAADPAANRNFGNSVSISGDTMVIGSPSNANDGSVYVFRWNGTAWTQEQKISGPNIVAGPQTGFGRVVAISGNTMVIGANVDDTAATDAGAAFVYERIAGVWNLQQKLTASNAAANDNFSDAIAIDGDTIVVAAPSADSGGTDRGSVYAFVRSGSVWSQQAILPAITGAANGDKVGEGNALSINGDTVAVGARSAASNNGRVGLYKRQIATWNLDTTLSSPDSGTDTTGRFGSSVSVRGDALAVGALTSVKTVTTGGGAYVYRRTSGTWGASSSGVLVVPAGLANGDNYGGALSLGNDFLVVGAQGGPANTGSAFAFRFRDGTWQADTKLIPLDAAVGDSFGYAVAVDGDFAVVSAQEDDLPSLTNAGSAWVFSRDNNQWLAGDITLTGTSAGSNDQNGQACAIDGDYAISGAEGATDTGAANSGVAYIWNRGTSTGWAQQLRLTSGSQEANQLFGRSVAISGNTVIVGVPGRDFGIATDQGCVFLYTRNGSAWPAASTSMGAIAIPPGYLTSSTTPSANEYFGQSVGISGGTAIVGAWGYDAPGLSNSGTAHIAIRNANNIWQMNSRIEAADKASNDNFGYSVAISGDYAVVGAYGKNGNTGAAYVFQRNGASFRQIQKLSSNDLAAGDGFGIGVAIDGDTIVVGAYTKNINGNAAQGAAYIFSRATNAATFTQVARIVASDGQPGDNFGYSVSVSGRSVTVGGFKHNVSNWNQVGQVYLFVNLSGETNGPWIGDTFKYTPAAILAQSSPTNSYTGRGQAVSGQTIFAGSYGAGTNQGRVSFTDFTDATQTGIANMTAQQTALTLPDAMSAATAGQNIVATGGAFNTASVNYGGKAINVRSRTSIAQNSISQIALADGATLSTGGPNYPVNLYGTVRTANDSGRSEISGGTIRQGSSGSIIVGKHEISLNSYSTNLEGRASLETADSAISSNGILSFRGNLSGLDGGRITSASGLLFDGIVNLRNTSISTGGPLTVATNTNMTGVNVASASNVVTSGGRWVFGGTLMGPLNNTGKVITAGASSIYGSIVNNTGAIIDLTGGATALYGSVANSGTLTGSFSGCPTCIGLPVGLRIESDLSMAEGGGLSIAGGSVEVGRSFFSTAFDSQPFNMLAGGIRMNNSGQGASTMEAMSRDYGPAGAALRADIDSSFPVGILEVGPNATVLNLVDAFDNDARGQSVREAVYVETLIVNPGSRLNTGGIKVYARYTSIAGTVDNINNIITLGAQCDADLQIDAVVDDADFSSFITAYDVAACSDSAMPRLGGGGCRADLNYDGIVDDADFQVFVVAYDQLLCN